MTDVINVLSDSAQIAAKTSVKSSEKSNSKSVKAKTFDSALDKANNKTGNGSNASSDNTADTVDNKVVTNKNEDKESENRADQSLQVSKETEKNIDSTNVNGDAQQITTTNVSNVYSINILGTMVNADDVTIVNDKTPLLASLQKKLAGSGNITDSSNNIDAGSESNINNKSADVIKNIIVDSKNTNGTAKILSAGNISQKPASDILLSASKTDLAPAVQQQNQNNTILNNTADTNIVSVVQNKSGQNESGLLNVLAAQTNNATNMQTGQTVAAGKTTEGQLTQLIQQFAGQTTEVKDAVSKAIQEKNDKSSSVAVINATTATTSSSTTDAGILNVKNVDDVILKQMNDTALQQDTAGDQPGNGNADDNASFAAQLTKGNAEQQMMVNGTQIDAQPLQQRQDAYDISGQIIKNAQLLKGNDNSQMIINLQPEHLGELAVKINVHSDGMVSASFHSDNAQVRNLIQASVVQLRQDLQNQGIKVDNINVYSGLGDLLSNGQQNNSSEFTGEQKKSQYRIHQMIEATGQLEDSSVADSINQQTSATKGIDYKI